MDMFPIERSAYLQTYLLEAEQIDKLKWLESEKAGHDIGIHRARWIWLTRHRAMWLAQQRQNQYSGIQPQH